MPEFYGAVESRRTVRDFLPDPVPQETLDRCLDAALLAPSSSNLQPWEFVIIRDPLIRQAANAACLDQLPAKSAPLLIALVTHRVPDGTEPDDIRRLALDVRDRVPRERPGVVAVVGVPADKPVVVIAVNEAGRDVGLSAGSLVGVAARALGGNGGGKPDVAQGGGAPVAHPGVIDEAFEAVREALRDRVESGR